MIVQPASPQFAVVFDAVLVQVGILDAADLGVFVDFDCELL